MSKRILFVVAAIGMLILSYVWYISGQVKWIKGDKVEIINITPSSEEIATWQTHQNQKYGFQVAYPKDFYLRDSHGMTSGTFAAIYHKKEKSNGMEVYVVRDDNELDLKITSSRSFDSYVDSYIKILAPERDERKRYFKQEITFNGYNARLVQWQGFKELKRIFIHHNQLVFIVEAVSFPGYENVIEQILSTVKFTQ